MKKIVFAAVAVLSPLTAFAFDDGYVTRSYVEAIDSHDGTEQWGQVEFEDYTFDDGSTATRIINDYKGNHAEVWYRDSGSFDSAAQRASDSNGASVNPDDRK